MEEPKRTKAGMVVATVYKVVLRLIATTLPRAQ
jgi:hypothetical protein